MNLMPTDQVSSAIASATLVLAAGTLSAQGTVWTVDDDGPADFISVYEALTVAGDGDVILIEDGFYSGPTHTIDGKSLTLVGDGVGVQLAGIDLVVENLTAGQSFVLRGIDGTGAFLTIRNNAGTVWIEDGYWTWDFGSTDIARITVENSTAVNLHRSRFFGAEAFSLFDPTSPGLRASASTVNVFDTVIEGGSTSVSTPSSEGVELLNGAVLFSSGCEFGGVPGTTGLSLRKGDPVAYLLDTTTTTAVLTGSIIQLPGSSRSFHGPSPVREDEVALLTYQGQANDLVFAAVGLEPGSLLSVPFLGVFMHTPIPPPVVITMGSTPAFGILQVPVQAPQLAPGVGAAHLVLQAAAVTATGQIVLAPASHITLLDGAF